MQQGSLKKYIYLSLAIAIFTITLKFFAFYYTKSVGLLSDAIEGIVNLLASSFALIMIIISETPADEKHEFGHTKAEYFSSAIEGLLIIVAAIAIFWSAIMRIITPVELENIGIGVVFSLIATLGNLIVAKILIYNGKKHNSLLLEADGKHLFTDVYTTVGVLIALLLVKLTGYLIIDPLIAIFVAINISITGYRLVKRSADGLMDATLSDEDILKITTYLNGKKTDTIDYHSLLTRQAGQRKFISFHLLVPGSWSVQEGHDFSDKIECVLEDMFDGMATVTTHIEPIEDPASLHDIGIDRIRQ